MSIFYNPEQCEDLFLELLELEQFYVKNPDNLRRVSTVLDGKISLRIVDWFVTNYSRKYAVVTNNRQGLLYNNYRTTLQVYRRKNFDPFRRQSIPLQFTIDGKEYDTTLGQLLFLKWCFTFNIIEYCLKNRELIKEDMDSSFQRSRFLKMLHGKKRIRTVSDTLSKAHFYVE